LDYFGLSPRDIIVIYDDMDLDLGRLRIRKGGSSGGHRGVQSIIDYLDSKDFIRVRLGIGRPVEGAGERGERGGRGGQGDPIDYVLSPFTPAEMDVLQDMIDKAKEAILTTVQKDVDFSMNRFNM
jgi:PTH1 family peptidyl-tRNA hydrolase